MKLYHTTQEEWSRNAPLPVCRNSICRYSGHSYPHVCFSEAPVAGMGRHVHSVDVAPREVARFAFTDVFRNNTKSYAIPVGLLFSRAWQADTYEAITGLPWDEWEVLVEDRYSAQDQETWALVWMSHPHSVEVQGERQRGAEKYLTLRLTETFDPSEDYLICETHERRTTECEREHHSWQLDLLAGVMPKWGVFPWAWARWVRDEEVVQSAIEYILRIAPEVERHIDFARSMPTKSNQARAWRIVAEEVGRKLNRDLGMFTGASATAARSIPIKMASRISQDSPTGEWAPPRPKPEYQHPDHSGRILLANQYGANPTRGPGVEEFTVTPFRRAPASHSRR